jgi:hypothetical protein
VTDTKQDVDPWLAHFDDELSWHLPEAALELIRGARARYVERVAAGEDPETVFASERDPLIPAMVKINLSVRRMRAQINLINNRAGRRAAKKRR